MDQQEIWDDLVGDAWVRFAQVLDAHSAPFGVAAMDALGALDGATALDVGCGAGETTMQLADRAGPGGRVTGVDLSTRMIERARAAAADRPTVTFVDGDVATVRLDGPVDAVYSRFGVMFFAQPIETFAHLRSLTRRGARLGFAAWSDPFSNPWMLEPILAAAAVLGPPELPGPGEPGPFSLASPDVLNTTLAAAGWTGVEISELSVEQPFLAGDARATAAMMSETNPIFARGLREKPEVRAELVDAVADALKPHERDGLVVLRATASIVRATS